MNPYLRPEDLELSEPTNNDLPPTKPDPGDYDLPTYEEMHAEWAYQHEALMGGFCSRFPDIPEGSNIVGHYEPME